MSDYKVTDTELISVANAIRTKTNTQAQLEWPSGFISGINEITSGSTPNRLYLIDPDDLDTFASSTYKEGGLPCSAAEAMYYSDHPFRVLSSSFDGENNKACIYRDNYGVGGMIFTKKIEGGKYSKLYAKLKVVDGGQSQDCRSAICARSTFDFSNEDGWVETGTNVWFLINSSKTATEINNQSGIVINVTDNKNCPEQIVEITLPGTDCYIAFDNWLCSIFVREMYVE